MMKRLAAGLLLSLAAIPTAFAATFGDTLGRDRIDIVVQGEIDRFRDEARKKSVDVEVTPLFSGAVADLIQAVEAPTQKDEAEAHLRRGFGLFLERFAAFLLTREPSGRIRLSEDRLKDYLKDAAEAKQCGMFPCPIPPCCKNCDFPPCK